MRTSNILFALFISMPLPLMADNPNNGPLPPNITGTYSGTQNSPNDCQGVSDTWGPFTEGFNAKWYIVHDPATGFVRATEVAPPTEDSPGFTLKYYGVIPHHKNDLNGKYEVGLSLCDVSQALTGWEITTRWPITVNEDILGSVGDIQVIDAPAYLMGRDVSGFGVGNFVETCLDNLSRESASVPKEFLDQGDCNFDKARAQHKKFEGKE